MDVLKKLSRWLLILVLSIGLFCFGLWWLVTQPFVAYHKRTPPPSVSTENLKRHIDHLVYQLSPRNHDTDQLNKTVVYLQEILSGYSEQVELQEFDVWGIPYQNVIARFGPQSGPRIVVGAHYDVAAENPGADDNASGVAVLLELARLFKQTPPPVRIDLAAYALEEPPYFRTVDMGSYRHARMLYEQQVDVKFMVSLEMLGYYCDEPGCQNYPIPLLDHFYPDKGNFIALAGRFSEAGLLRDFKTSMRFANQLPVYSISAPPLLPGLDFSDHQGFWQHGFPAFMITDTSFYRNPHYHTEQDLPETLDFSRMTTAAELVYVALMAQANKAFADLP